MVIADDFDGVWGDIDWMRQDCDQVLDEYS
jgi:hypothetical protein